MYTSPLGWESSPIFAQNVMNNEWNTVFLINYTWNNEHPPGVGKSTMVMIYKQEVPSEESFEEPQIFR